MVRGLTSYKTLPRGRDFLGEQMQAGKRRRAPGVQLSFLPMGKLEHGQEDSLTWTPKQVDEELGKAQRQVPRSHAHKMVIGVCLNKSL